MYSPLSGVTGRSTVGHFESPGHWARATSPGLGGEREEVGLQKAAILTRQRGGSKGNNAFDRRSHGS